MRCRVNTGTSQPVPDTESQTRPSSAMCKASSKSTSYHFWQNSDVSWANLLSGKSHAHILLNDSRGKRSSPCSSSPLSLSPAKICRSPACEVGFEWYVRKLRKLPLKAGWACAAAFLFSKRANTLPKNLVIRQTCECQGRLSSSSHAGIWDCQLCKPSLHYSTNPWP